jgi:MFS family permease
MYSETDIDAAVRAGAITPDAAQALRAHVAAARRTPAVDEESFRLLTGFNDIFVTIAIGLLLAAVAGIGGQVSPYLPSPVVAVAAWWLAEYFTRRRRMALPSIALLIAFVGGVAGTLATPFIHNHASVGAWLEGLSTDQNVRNAVAGLIAAAIAALTASAAWLHWRRFMVPITVAAGAVAVVAVALSLIVGLIPPAKDAIYPLVLVAGIAMFAFAMRWDMSDRERRTRRSDVAFWLHLAAAPMIAHALFNLLGVFAGEMDAVRALVVLILYVAFALVALAVDRRALLVSSLVYVLYALYQLFRQAGAVELSAGFTGLVIGSALLLLSAFWHKARSRVVAQLGTRGRFLPPVAATA